MAGTEWGIKRLSYYDYIGLAQGGIGIYIVFNNLILEHLEPGHIYGLFRI
jgi:hypothetical protein